MPHRIPPDSTLETIWSRLTHQREFAVGVLAKARLCVKQHGNAGVRIGVTGTGQKPCYRIVFAKAGSEKIFGSFWDMHDPLASEHAISENWSSASMTFEELELFLTSKYPVKKKA